MKSWVLCLCALAVGVFVCLPAQKASAQGCYITEQWKQQAWQAMDQVEQLKNATSAAAAECNTLRSQVMILLNRAGGCPALAGNMAGYEADLAAADQDDSDAEAYYIAGATPRAAAIAHYDSGLAWYYGWNRSPSCPLATAEFQACVSDANAAAIHYTNAKNKQLACKGKLQALKLLLETALQWSNC